MVEEGRNSDGSPAVDDEAAFEARTEFGVRFEAALNEALPDGLLVGHDPEDHEEWAGVIVGAMLSFSPAGPIAVGTRAAADAGRAVHDSVRPDEDVDWDRVRRAAGTVAGAVGGAAAAAGTGAGGPLALGAAVGTVVGYAGGTAGNALARRSDRIRDGWENPTDHLPPGTEAEIEAEITELRAGSEEVGQAAGDEAVDTAATTTVTDHEAGARTDEPSFEPGRIERAIDRTTAGAVEAVAGAYEWAGDRVVDVVDRMLEEREEAGETRSRAEEAPDAEERDGNDRSE